MGQRKMREKQIKLMSKLTSNKILKIIELQSLKIYYLEILVIGIKILIMKMASLMMNKILNMMTTLTMMMMKAKRINKMIKMILELFPMNG